jgi:hypothetical protein
MVSTNHVTGLSAFWQTQNATLAGSSNRFPRGLLALRIHLLLMNVPKYDLRVVDKAMFQGVNRPSEHIFCLLGIQKCDLDVVEEAMIQVVEWP